MKFDYIVVGAGAAGCALARRLSVDHSINVLLIESGGRRGGFGARVPRALPIALRSPLLTSYRTLPLAGRDEPGYWARGCGLGGSTLVNGMLYLRGEPAAYDELAAAGNPGWGWQAFDAAYREIEHRFVHPSTSSLNGLDHVALQAMSTCGIPLVDDVNATSGPRAGASAATVHRGRRRDAATAFLASARHRRNLCVLPRTAARSLLWQGDRIVGVLAQHGTSVREIRAEAVVLCAGTIETPLLLERSGIGRADLLHAAGIPLRVESPNVGERVREQHAQTLQLRLRRGTPGAEELSSPVAVAAQAARYAVTGGGPLARPAYDVTAMLATDGGSTADLQVLIAPFALADSHQLRPARYPGLLMSGYRIRSTTHGFVHLDPADPDGAPHIAAPHRPSGDGPQPHRPPLETLRSIAYAGPLGELVEREVHAGDGFAGSSIYHAVGSAAMGPNDDDVVDPQLAVRGVAGLYVADLSVLPFHPSGGTAAPAMALGWLAGARLAAQRN